MKRFSKVMIATVLYLCISCSNNSLELIPAKQGEKWGYINKKGTYVINPQFEGADFFFDGLARVCSDDGKIGFINTDGKYVIFAQYLSATPFSEGLAFVVPECGYPVCIDKKGETMFSLKQAEAVVSFSEGLALFFATAEEKWGFVDKTGKVVINPQFEVAMPFSEGLAAILQNDKWGFIDKSGKIVINPQFDEVQSFKNGKAPFCSGKKWGFIDAKGSYVVNPQFDEASIFSDEMAIIVTGKYPNDKYGFINKEGKIAVNPQFEKVFWFKSGLSPFLQGEKWGYINKQGKIEINPQFDYASPFFDDIAFVRSGEKWGIIDKKGNFIVNPQFDELPRLLYTDLDYDVARYMLLVRSDYYDATAFINKFFEKAVGNNSFDGFTANSTIADISENPLYANQRQTDYGEYMAGTHNNRKITDDISVAITRFYTDNPINISEKLATIQYTFEFERSANGKENAIVNALKTEIERRYNVKMQREKNEEGYVYTAYQENGLSFAIECKKGFYHPVDLYITFVSNNLYNLINKTVQEEVREADVIEEEAPAD